MTINGRLNCDNFDFHCSVSYPLISTYVSPIKKSGKYFFVCPLYWYVNDSVFRTNGIWCSSWYIIHDSSHDESHQYPLYQPFFPIPDPRRWPPDFFPAFMLNDIFFRRSISESSVKAQPNFQLSSLHRLGLTHFLGTCPIQRSFSCSPHWTLEHFTEQNFRLVLVVVNFFPQRSHDLVIVESDLSLLFCTPKHLLEQNTLVLPLERLRSCSTEYRWNVFPQTLQTNWTIFIVHLIHISHYRLSSKIWEFYNLFIFQNGSDNWIWYQYVENGLLYFLTPTHVFLCRCGVSTSLVLKSPVWDRVSIFRHIQMEAGPAFASGAKRYERFELRHTLACKWWRHGESNSGLMLERQLFYHWTMTPYKHISYRLFTYSNSDRVEVCVIRI